VLGPRSRRDAQDDSGIIVDFTFDEAQPPLALEVTTVQDDSFLSARSQALKLVDRLREAGEREGLPPFMFSINERTDMKAVFEPLLELMRSGEKTRPGQYTSGDLKRWDSEGTLRDNLAWHQMLESWGIGEAYPLPDGRSTTVATWGESFGGWAPATGVEDVVAANLTKLIAVGTSYEKHLAVGIGKYRVSQYVELTPVPHLPQGLDRLWLVHLWVGPMGRQIWSYSPNDASWRVHSDPAH